MIYQYLIDIQKTETNIATKKMNHLSDGASYIYEVDSQSVLPSSPKSASLRVVTVE